jgi:hypothetical protein
MSYWYVVISALQIHDSVVPVREPPPCNATRLFNPIVSF